LAAGAGERHRSVFLVGDAKQSIYRFRRADPELFDTAQSWLQRQLGAIDQPLNVSWRSAPAVIDFVNILFGDGPLHARLTHFALHTTHHQDLWGRVEVLPLVEPTPDVERENRDTLRNPLIEPRLVVQDQRHREEGRLIADRIRALMEESISIGHEGEARPIQYSDIMILLRQRTHAEKMEQALREAGIPYASASRGTLLDSLEAQDMVALLEWLVAPFDNLALARVLRSPLFDCDHADLITLAREERGNWRDRLIVVGSRQPEHSALRRAHVLLERWREQVGMRPVHDLLDRIFSEGDVLRRYEAAYPAHLRHRAAANLNRFLELALEIDNGRYPSIGHFVARLRSLRQQDQEAPDEGTPTQAEARVRIMTIHASKGLEAPVVFLADTTNAHGAAKANQAIVDWPAAEARPACFLLAGKKDELDPFTRGVLEHHAMAEAREDANLLYVAVTRARQMLFISGCRPSRGQDLGWYGLIAERCDSSLDTPPVFESGRRPVAASATAPAKKPAPIDPRLSHPLATHTQGPIIIAPSGEVNAADEGEDARTRGIAIHRLLQLLCEGARNVTQRVGSEMGLEDDDAELSEWFDEAQRVFRNPAFSHFFDPGRYTAAYNEVPIQYAANGRTIHGIIDRLVIDGDTVWLLDYKTHSVTGKSALAPLAERYRAQIAHYVLGVQRLWPQKRVRSGLLFTAVSEWVEC
jgi:ATP-dependent helicase/nuclease subunit A